MTITEPKASAAKPESTPNKRGIPRWLRVLIPAALILVWFVVFSAGGSSFSQVNSVAKNDQVQHLPASADATQVQKLQSKFRGDDMIPAVVVYQRAGGVTASDRQAIATQLEKIRSTKGVVDGSVSPAILSKDGKAVEVIVPMDTSIKPADTVQTVRSYL